LYETVHRRVEHEDSPKVGSVWVIHELFERFLEFDGVGFGWEIVCLSNNVGGIN
jgi:hypothetical protein